MYRTLTLAALACSVALGGYAQAQKVENGEGGGVSGAGIPDLNAVRIASGLTLPLFVTAPPGDLNRLFVVEQRSGAIGRIKVIDLTTSPPTVSPTIYLSVSPVSQGNEQGLLGLAFHPDFLNNGYFYVYYTNPTNIVARYQANPPYATSATANPAGTIVLSITDPFSNHNGGWIAFAPNDTEGYLYVGTGDGGSANDPNGNGQNINALLGKMLRLDIDGADNIPGNDDDDGVIGSMFAPYTSPSSNPFVGVAGADQIWAIGLRNPWRNSFDRLTADLIIADVGQNAWEEIDFQPAASAGGENYGWRCMEGNACTGLTGCICNDAALTDPIVVQSHSAGNCSITGGYVYRGPAIPQLQGQYFFADYCSNQIRTFPTGPALNPPLTLRTTELAPGGSLSVNSITSFGEDAAGELYICDQGGEIYKIVEAPLNDLCVNATPISDGTFPIDTRNATTDGFAEAGCGFTGGTYAYNDVWYRYTATCTGTARVSLCGSSYNTRVVVYGATCPTAGGQQIACNDDSCGASSEVTWSATSGGTYRIRVGGANFLNGVGTMTVSCDTIKCPTDITGDGQTNVDDMLLVINGWGAPGEGDVNGDGITDVDDLLLVINGWGACA